MEKKNLFEIWKENHQRLPFRAILDSWAEELENYVIVEKIQIDKWPYGKAYGQYFFHGKRDRNGQIDNAGTFRWRRLA